MKAVVAAFRVRPAGIASGDKSELYARPRMALITLLREHHGASYRSIGERLTMSHVAALKMHQRHAERVERDAPYRTKFERARALLGGQLR